MIQPNSFVELTQAIGGTPTVSTAAALAVAWCLETIPSIQASAYFFHSKGGRWELGYFRGVREKQSFTEDDIPSKESRIIEAWAATAFPLTSHSDGLVPQRPYELSPDDHTCQVIKAIVGTEVFTTLVPLADHTRFYGTIVLYTNQSLLNEVDTWSASERTLSELHLISSIVATRLSVVRRSAEAVAVAEISQILTSIEQTSQTDSLRNPYTQALDVLVGEHFPFVAAVLRLRDDDEALQIVAKAPTADNTLIRRSK